MDKGSNLNAVFWLHLLIVICAWTGPFFFSWWIIIPIYIAVQLQFIFLKKCVMNSSHDLIEEDDYTFYSFLFESFGIYWDRKKIKHFIRKRLKYILIGVTVLWQIVLEFEPLLF